MMKTFFRKAPLWIAILLLSRSSYAHDIHISYSQAELSGNQLHVKVSYYKDDFTKAVKNWYEGKADNYSPAQFQSAEFEYIKNYFRVWSDAFLSQQVLPKLLKISEDGTSIIFELQFSVENFSSLVIDEQVLFREYKDQMNIFYIKAPSKEANHIFTPSKPTLLFKP